MLRARLLQACLPMLSAAAFLAASPAVHAANTPVEADRIVAVVNDEVITLRELQARMLVAEGQLRRQGIALPTRDVFQRQMLERLVIDRIQVQSARETGIQIDDAQLDQAIARIAAANQLSLADFRTALEKDGIAYAKFREDMREEITIARLREREVDNRIAISDAEIDNFLANEKRSGAARQEYELSHILIRVPEGASPEQLQKARARAEEARGRALGGEDFAKVAAAYSDAPDALQGGSIGTRSLERLPTLYADAAQRMKDGEVSPILRSANGFHLLKVHGRKGGGAVPDVQQTRARHILIRANELVTDAEARHKLDGLRDRLIHGGDFAELAKLFSQDGSAPKGGDLGWVYPGDTVPDFERAMDALKPGEISQPIRSPFGWHLIQVLERRVQSVSADRQRVLARQALRERRMEDAYQDWIRQLRDRAYVELRLDEQ